MCVLIAIVVVIGIAVVVMGNRLGYFKFKAFGLSGEAKTQAGPSASDNVIIGERQRVIVKGAGAKADKNKLHGSDITIDVGTSASRGEIGKDPNPE